MVLDHEIRGRTENTIDLTIEQIPYLIGIFRTEEFKKKYHIQNETDLTLGMVWGYLFRGFQDMFTVSYQRQPNQDEINTDKRTSRKSDYYIRQIVHSIVS